MDKIKKYRRSPEVQEKIDERVEYFIKSAHGLLDKYFLELDNKFDREIRNSIVRALVTCIFDDGIDAGINISKDAG